MKLNVKKKIKILWMLSWCEYMIGVETATYTSVKELIRLGYNVSIFTFLRGKMWDKMKKTGANLLNEEIEDDYDLCIVNGNPCMTRVPSKSYKIFISNGIIPSVEQPIPGADKYVSVSEETQQNLKRLGYDSIIIRNGIDCERFKPTKPINKKLKNVLLLSNKAHPQTKEFMIIDQACKEMKLNLTVCGLSCGTAQWEVEEHINNSDLIISVGRGIYEAMACERNAIVAAYELNDGIVNNSSFYEFRKNNCSGRRYNIPLSVKNLLDEFKKYDYKQGAKNRKLILENNNVVKTVENFLDIYTYRNKNL